MKPILPAVCGMGGIPKIGDDFFLGGGGGAKTNKPKFKKIINNR